MSLTIAERGQRSPHNKRRAPLLAGTPGRHPRRPRPQEPHRVVCRRQHHLHHRGDDGRQKGAAGGRDAGTAEVVPRAACGLSWDPQCSSACIGARVLHPHANHSPPFPGRHQPQPGHQLCQGLWHPVHRRGPAAAVCAPDQLGRVDAYDRRHHHDPRRRQGPAAAAQHRAHAGARGRQLPAGWERRQARWVTGTAATGGWELSSTHARPKPPPGGGRADHQEGHRPRLRDGGG